MVIEYVRYAVIWCYFAVIWVDEDDVTTYTIKAVDDPRTVNKTLYLRPSANILSQKEVVQIWEKYNGKALEKIYLSGDDFLNLMKGKPNLSISSTQLLLFNNNAYKINV